MSDVMYQASTADPTWAIWKHFPKRVGDADPRKNYLYHEDFVGFGTAPVLNLASNTGPFTHFIDTGGTVVDGGGANTSAATFANDTDNDVVSYVSVVTPIRITKGSGRKVAFGFRGKWSTIADTKFGSFLGLWEALTPTTSSHMADAGTLADKNFIGFHRLEGDGDQIDIVYKADGQTQVSFTDAQVLVADTYVKAEFFFDGDRSLSFWFNGTRYTTADVGAAALAATAFPSDINLGPAFIPIKNAASSPGSFTADWIRFGFTYGDAD